MNINELTIGNVKELIGMFGGMTDLAGEGGAVRNPKTGRFQNAQNKPPTFIEIGKNYLFRSCTYHYIGTVSKIRGDEIMLSPAAWLADSGRFSNALKTGAVNEVEPYVQESFCVVMRQALVDYCPWDHGVPKEVK